MFPIQLTAQPQLVKEMAALPEHSRAPHRPRRLPPETPSWQDLARLPVSELLDSRRLGPYNTGTRTVPGSVFVLSFVT